MMKRAVISWGSLVIVAMLGACTDPSSGGGGPIVRDSAGIVIVENRHSHPAWGNDGWRLTEQPAVQIGAVDAEGPDQLFGVTYSRLLPGGDVLVVNSRTQEVRIFDQSGRYRTTIGRRGEGPGEFQSPWQAYPMSADSLLVVDLYRAVSVFDERGTYIRRFVPGGVAGERGGAPIGQFGDGTLLFMRYQPQDPTWVGVRRSQVELVRFDLDGDVATNFGLFDDQTVRYGEGPRYLFGAWAKSAPAANSLYYGPGDRFELREIGFDGRDERLIRLDLPLRPVTSADTDAFLEATRDRMREQGQEAVFDRLWADVEAPSHFPAHFEIRVDDDDYIWVQDYQPFTAQVARTWYVFSPYGNYLGAIVTPPRFTVHHIAKEYIVGRWTDELEVEYVQVYRVENRR